MKQKEPAEIRYTKMDESGKKVVKTANEIVREIEERRLEILFGPMFDDDVSASDVVYEALGLVSEISKDDGFINEKRTWLADEDWDDDESREATEEELLNHCGYDGSIDTLLDYLDEMDEMGDYVESWYLPKSESRDSMDMAKLLNDIHLDSLGSIEAEDMERIAEELGYDIEGDAVDVYDLEDTVEIETVRVGGMGWPDKMLPAITLATSALGYEAVLDEMGKEIGEKIAAAMSLRDMESLRVIGEEYGEKIAAYGLIPTPEDDDGARGILAVAYNHEEDRVDMLSCWYASALRYARRVAEERGENYFNGDVLRGILSPLVEDVRSGNLGAMAPEEYDDCGGMPCL